MQVLCIEQLASITKTVVLVRAMVDSRESTGTLRGGVTVTRGSHKPRNSGSNPDLATMEKKKVGRPKKEPTKVVSVRVPVPCVQPVREAADNIVNQYKLKQDESK
jgi:hypothetical protein